MRVLVYYAHPGHKYSHANKALMMAARGIDGITLVDLYAEYPQHNIDVAREQERLNSHDAILFQFPLFWYSAPSLVKEWQDLVLEYDYAYGPKGKALTGKYMGLVITAGGSRNSYQEGAFQGLPLPAFLTPFERTAGLCNMHYLPPYLYFAALKDPAINGLDDHVAGYRTYLQGLRDDTLPLQNLLALSELSADALIKSEA